MDSTKRQNWLKQKERKKATYTKKTRIKEQTVPKKQPSQSTEQNTFSSYYLSQSNFLLVYLKIVIKLHQGLRFHKHSILAAKKSYS